MTKRFENPTIKQVKTDEFGGFHVLVEGTQGKRVIEVEPEDDPNDVELCELVDPSDGVVYWANLSELMDVNQARQTQERLEHFTK